MTILLSRSLLVALVVASSFALGAGAQAPPPFDMTLAWSAQPADPKASSTKVTYRVYGDQLTKTVELAAAKGAPPLEQVTTATVDVDAITKLVPAFPREKHVTLPARRADEGQGEQLFVSLVVNGSVLAITGEAPRRPTGELIAVKALRAALEKSAVEEMPSAKPALP